MGSCKVLGEGQVVWEQLPHVHILQYLDGANHFPGMERCSQQPCKLASSCFVSLAIAVDVTCRVNETTSPQYGLLIIVTVASAVATIHI